MYIIHDQCNLKPRTFVYSIVILATAIPQYSTYIQYTFKVVFPVYLIHSKEVFIATLCYKVSFSLKGACSKRRVNVIIYYLTDFNAAKIDL